MDDMIATVVCIVLGTCAGDPDTIPVTAGQVYDGDTITFEDARNVRLTGEGNAPFDTPEIAQNAGCPSEQRRGTAARDLVRKHMPGEVRIIPGDGGYGRRLGVLYTSDGRGVRDVLMAEGLAVAGETLDWCEER